MVAAKEIHRGTYIVNHVVDHDSAELHRVNELLQPLGDLFFIQNIFEKKNMASTYSQLGIVLNGSTILFPTLEF